MEVKGSFYYKKGLILDKKRLDEIQQLLMQYCERIEYSAELKNNTEINFEDYAELVNYENYASKKIEKLSLRGYKDKYSSNVKIDVGTVNHAFTFVCLYNFSTLDEEELFKSKTHIILQKAENKLWFLSKVSFSSIAYWFCAFYTLVFTVPALISGNMSFDASSPWFLLLLLATLPLVFFMNKLVGFLDEKWKNLFPCFVFKLGEEIENYENKSKLRSGILWTVIIGGVVSVGAGIVTNLL